MNPGYDRSVITGLEQPWDRIEENGAACEDRSVAPPWLPVPPPAYGGTEAVIDRLARGFMGQGHHVELFTTGDSECWPWRR